MTKQTLTRAIRLPLLAAAFSMTACDDPFANQPWSAVPDTLTLFSAARDDYAGIPAALNIAGSSVSVVAIDQAGAAAEWDFLLNEEEGALVLVPSGIVPGLESRAGLFRSDETTLEAVTRAPSGSDSYSSEAVALELNAIYVLRSRRAGCGFTSGSNYGKMKVVALDVALGTAQLAVVRNPYCDDRDLIPPEDD